jgi:hypothetical protein
MEQIKLVDKNTDLSNIKPYDWDLVIKDRPYYVCRLEGYIHRIGGHYNNNDLWCYPRDEQPTVDNLLEFDGTPVRWGFEVNDNNFTKFKWDEGEVLHNHSIVVTRNGKPFYSFGSSGVAYGTGKALEIVESISEHPLDFNMIDYDQKMIGRKVWWYNAPAKIARWVDGQACVILEPDGIDKFPIPACFANEDYEEEETDIKTDIFDKHIWWFRD